MYVCMYIYTCILYPRVRSLSRPLIRLSSRPSISATPFHFPGGKSYRGTPRRPFFACSVRLPILRSARKWILIPGFRSEGSSDADQARFVPRSRATTTPPLYLYFLRSLYASRLTSFAVRLTRSIHSPIRRNTRTEL